MPKWIESVELAVAFKLSDFSNTKGTVNNSTEVFADKDCVFNIVNSVDVELSKTSKDNVGVLEVLLVTLIDLIIIVSLLADAISEVSAVVAKATPLNL